MTAATNIFKTISFRFLPACLFVFASVFSPSSVCFSAGAAGALAELTSGADFAPFPAPRLIFYSPTAASSLKVYFINVGQGDSGYIELPNGKNVLIDGGPANPSGSGDPMLAQFLTQRNITRINHMVLTHPHADHYAGLQYVADHMKVDNFYDTQIDNTGATSDNALREQIRKSGANVFYPAAGDTLNWAPGEVLVKVLHSCPAPAQSSVGQVINDCSIVLKVTYQDTSILYTGDLQDDLEPALISQYGSGLKADIFKVGHHGSQHSTSDAFLAAVRPRDAVISVGADNSYGHPTPGCLSRLRAAGAAIHRTDTDGTMMYTIGAN